LRGPPTNEHVSQLVNIDDYWMLMSHHGTRSQVSPRLSCIAHMANTIIRRIHACKQSANLSFPIRIYTLMENVSIVDIAAIPKRNDQH